jgi:hypothetical protein
MWVAMRPANVDRNKKAALLAAFLLQIELSRYIECDLDVTAQVARRNCGPGHFDYCVNWSRD